MRERVSRVLTLIGRWFRTLSHRVVKPVRSRGRRRAAPQRPTAMPATTPPTSPTAGDASSELGLIAEAHREWMSARAMFEQVSDPELVDQAIHRMTAAEKRYIYLWKQARQAGIAGKFPPPHSYS